jgi:hypothetical protein
MSPQVLHNSLHFAMILISIFHCLSPICFSFGYFDQEIMEIGLICSNLIEKSHHSSNLGQGSAGLF